jgi:hypothetical protein
MNQGTYMEKLKPIPITEQIESESVDKGSPLWKERQDFHWKTEIERMLIPWPVKGDIKLERMDERREWKLRHLEIPFLRYPRREENAVQIMDLPDNQEAVQEMVARNPLFKEPKSWNLWLDKLHPERVIERDRRLAEDRRVLEERWQQEMQRRATERQAQALVQNQRVELVEQNLGRWIRQIEADERMRMESPTERRTMERRQEIQVNRRYFERDGRFQGIIEDVRRLPNGPERQKVFRRFWANLYTQEYQNPLAREEAEVLALRTAALRELGALEDEERRETGGRELVRPLTLYREDGSLAGGWDRSSPATVASVSALE